MSGALWQDSLARLGKVKVMGNSWVVTEHKDISFEHCNRPAYWDNDEVYCSKCSTKLEG